jgi:hypothetical protein
MGNHRPEIFRITLLLASMLTFSTEFRSILLRCDSKSLFWIILKKMVGDPGIEPGVRLREGVTVPCHTLRPVAHLKLRRLALARKRLRLRKSHVNPKMTID